MPSFAEVELIGYLGKDPEMRLMPSGSYVTNFSVATTRKWKDSAGNDQEETIWWRVSTFGKVAENCNSYLKKGSLVHIIGRMIPDITTHGPKVFKKTDGSYGANYELCAEKILFLDSKNGHNSNYVQDMDENGNPIIHNSPNQSPVPAVQLDEDNFPI
jgi:single-strand DNA-binding protein